MYYLREALGNNTLVLFQLAHMASTPSPQGEVYEPLKGRSLVEGVFTGTTSSFF